MKSSKICNNIVALICLVLVLSRSESMLAGKSDHVENSKAPFRCLRKCLCSGDMETILCEYSPPDIIKHFQAKLGAAKRLSIRNSKIDQLYNDTFNNMLLMAELTITRSYMYGIAEKSLQQFPRLTHLDLSFNKIEIVGKPVSFMDKHFNWAVAHLPNFMTSKLLRYVDLSGNSIRHISQEQLYGMKYVQHLNLSSNNILRIDSGYTLLMGLKELDLSYNRITEVDVKFGASQLLLEELYLSHNYIRKIPTLEYFSCAHLERMDVSFNDLHEIMSVGISHCSNIKYLNLENNKISLIKDSDFQFLTELEILNVARNQIKSIQNGSFDFNSKLQELYISDNSITHIDDFTFFGLKSATIMDLSKNRITFVAENTFNKNVWLCYLYLHGNKVHHIAPKTFKNLPLLRIVNLSDNLLTTPYSSWFLSPSGEFYFNVTELKVEERIRTTTATFLTSGNNWMCDCSTKDFHRWALGQTNSSGQATASPRIVCYSPSFHSGKNLLKLEAAKLSCDTMFHAKYFILYHKRYFLMSTLIILTLVAYLRKAALAKRRFHNL
ncbi:uncharacterized protein LOC120345799 [Styela clava]